MEVGMNFFGGTNDEEGYSAQQTNDGGYIISGILKMEIQISI